jgi:Ca2+-binding EF-hand superfamily protein
LFKRLDANGDGKVAADELPAERREAMLKNLDTDGDQSVSRAEFAAGAAALARRARERGLPGQPRPGQLGPGQTDERRPPPGSVRLTAALDSDGDGDLSSDEIAAAAESLKKLDRNGDGRIDRKELGAAGPNRDASVAAAPDRANAEVVLRRILAADKNGDGKVSLEEAPERLKKAFDKIDANSDGLLDSEELSARFDKAKKKIQAKPAKAKKKGKKKSKKPAASAKPN